MARIAGIDIPKNKRGVIALTYIFGIGRFYFFQNDYKNAEKYFLEAKDLNPEWLNYAAAKSHKVPADRESNNHINQNN